MSELVQSTFEKAEEPDKLGPEKNVRQFLSMLATHGSKLAARRFTALELAKEEGAGFAAVTNEIASGIEDMQKVKVRVTGADVKISNVNFDNDPETGIVVEIDTQEPFVTPDPLAEHIGYYHSVPLIFGKDEEGYFAVPHIVLQNTHGAELPGDGDGIPTAGIYVKYYLKAPLGGDIYMDVPKLEAHEAQVAAIAEVMLTSAEHQYIRDALEGLKGEFDNTDDTKFLPLKGVEYLHLLADVTEAEADRESVTTALGEVVGRGRSVKLEGSAFYGIEIGEMENYKLEGKIVEILAFHEKLEIDEPLIVIEVRKPTDDEEDENTPKTTLYYVPLSYITAFYF